MKRKLDENIVNKIMLHLLERFGEPIGDAQGDHQGVPNKGGHKEDMGNRGFGAKFESPAACDQCGGMMGMDEVECTNCGMMPGEVIDTGEPKAPVGQYSSGEAPELDAVVVVGGHANPRGTVPGTSAKGISPSVHPPKGMDGIPETGSGRLTGNKPMPLSIDESEAGGRHPGHASSCTCPDCQPNREKPPMGEAARAHASAQEVLTTYEDLYNNSIDGAVSLEELASWLGVTPEAVKQVMHKVGLLVDKHGNVVERGMTPMPGTMKAAHRTASIDG